MLLAILCCRRILVSENDRLLLRMASCLSGQFIGFMPLVQSCAMYEPKIDDHVGSATGPAVMACTLGLMSVHSIRSFQNTSADFHLLPKGSCKM